MNKPLITLTLVSFLLIPINGYAGIHLGKAVVDEAMLAGIVGVEIARKNAIASFNIKLSPVINLGWSYYARNGDSPNDLKDNLDILQESMIEYERIIRNTSDLPDILGLAVTVLEAVKLIEEYSYNEGWDDLSEQAEILENKMQNDMDNNWDNVGGVTVDNSMLSGAELVRLAIEQTVQKYRELVKPTIIEAENLLEGMRGAGNWQKFEELEKMITTLEESIAEYSHAISNEGSVIPIFINVMGASEGLWNFGIKHELFYLEKKAYALNNALTRDLNKGNWTLQDDIGANFYSGSYPLK